MTLCYLMVNPKSWNEDHPVTKNTMEKVKFHKVAMETLFQETQLENWFQSNKWKGEFSVNNLSNALRLVLLYKYGGVYFDTDMVSVVPFWRYMCQFLSDRTADNLFGSWERTDSINNAFLMTLAPRLPLFDVLLPHFVDNFNQVWANNGPVLISWLQQVYPEW
eukprot:CAMPEP_0174277264 /NCGR_PEP_ID=MMETSP0439-20130205/60833_1 /TAXON_ID=0 /ORGANISM="Stereomyxa ramosa, Strain Chinc5" /LENGTH=162 /DNA_ID=CAMNT_0015369565 /DNA_START=76 /DNA_END=561 /DNA_ORIENTATION=+